jgi:NAD+ kinase
MPGPAAQPPSAPESRIRRVGVVAKPGLERIGAEVRDIVEWLSRRGVEAIIDARTAQQSGLERPGAPSREALPPLVDLILVLGGDGTLLGMADRVAQAGLDTPILGVNYGTLGFLTEITLPDLYRALERTLDGTHDVDVRLMLDVRVIHHGHLQSQHVALNDVTVSGGSLSRIVEFRVSVDDEFVARFNADGVIVSTPTGSTAYNLSAGGPIVHPAVEALVLNPIAPHTLAHRPIVIPVSSRVAIHPILKRDDDEAYATYDGQRGEQLAPGDIVAIARSERSMRLVRAFPRSYYDVLREKLRWTER